MIFLLCLVRVDYKDRTPYNVAVQYDAPEIAALLKSVMEEGGRYDLS